MNELQLTDIYIYPVKSLGGISVQQAEVQQTGLQYDRRWMLTDKTGNFLSQRTHSEMALLQVNLTPDGLIITHKKNQLTPLTLPFYISTSRKVSVSIWDDVCTALEVSAIANEWFSDFLKMPAKLVYMPDTTKRMVDTKYATNKEIVSFADAYPCMMIGRSSLSDLNSRLEKPVSINRFRPNFVFSGGEPYCEDEMPMFSIGNVSFKAVKKCSRCVVTTINQEDAAKGKEPLKTLAGYRTINNKVMFGQNLLCINTGIVKAWDKIIINE